MSELIALAETAAIIASVAGSAAGAAYWLGRKLARLEGELKELKSRTSNLEGYVQQLGSRLTAVEREVGELKEEMAAVEGRLTRLEGAMAAVEGRLTRLEGAMAAVEGRLTQLEGAMAAVEGRLAQLEEGLASVRTTLASTEEGLEHVKGRVGRVEEGLSSLKGELAELKAGVTARFDKLEERVERVGRVVRSANELFVDLLGYEGILRAEAVTFAKSELARILELAENPLTKEEKERLKQLLEKDDLTLEEAQELYRIADKLVEEHGDKIEAWKLLWYSRAWIGINWRRMAEQRKKAEQKGS